MPDAACLIVPVSTVFRPCSLPATSPDLPSPPPYSVLPVVLFRLRLSLRPNPKRGLLSSRKFCSICILRLYSAIIWCGSRPSALLNSSHGSRALLRCSRCVLAFRPFHDARFRAPVQIKPSVTGRTWFTGQDTVPHADRLPGGLKLADFHPLFSPSSRKLMQPLTLPVKLQPSWLTCRNQFCSEAGIRNDGDGFIFRDGIMEAVKEATLYIAVLRQLCGNHLTHKRK